MMILLNDLLNWDELCASILRREKLCKLQRQDRRILDGEAVDLICDQERLSPDQFYICISTLWVGKDDDSDWRRSCLRFRTLLALVEGSWIAPRKWDRVESSPEPSPAKPSQSEPFPVHFRLYLFSGGGCQSTCRVIGGVDRNNLAPRNFFLLSSLFCRSTVSLIGQSLAEKS